MLGEGLIEIKRRGMYLPTWDEIAGAMADFGAPEVGFLVGLLLWLVLLALPLTGIDRRDSSTALTYALFLAASGVALVLAASRELPSPADFPIHFILVLAATGLALLKWHRCKEAPVTTSEQSAKEAS